VAWRVAGLVIAAMAAVAVLRIPAGAQVPITTSTTSSRPITSSTLKPTTTAAPTTAPSTTAKPRSTTTKPTTTTTQRPISTIPTPAANPATTTTVVAVSKHSGKFSPALTYFAFTGLLGGIGLLGLQWFLTRPGRHGWTL
jgi:serine/threonine-protein kinase